MSFENIIKESEGKMEQSVEVLKKEYATLRTSRATPSILDRITVSQYGAETPLQHVASVSAPDPKSLVIQPWDKTLLGEIEKAIQKSDLGLNPINDGSMIRLPIPPLTEERRNDLVKSCKKKAEEFRVAVRNVRRDANENLKALEKKSEITQDECKKSIDRIQKITDAHIEKINHVFDAKEKEILGK
ncbi:MAG: ribosome recycling factor [Candidatus Riflebacteria bacterium]|nr:ribosome recycling factor [Candidatus Riflebacteria bacterium]